MSLKASLVTGSPEKNELLEEVRQLSLRDCGTVLHFSGLQDPLRVGLWIIGRPAYRDSVERNRTYLLQDPGRDIE